MEPIVKRFWQAATVIEQEGAFAIALDGKPMRLPGGLALRLTHKVLAEAVAAEWHAAGGAPGGEMSMDDVPLTRLAGTAQHRISPDPAPIAQAIARYAETDVLCYRAPHPEDLSVRQHHAWQPWLDWAAANYGARLVVTHTVMPITQPPEALAALHRATAALDPFQLAALGVLVPAYGSLVLGLAVAAGRLSATEALNVAMLDEHFQEQKWGEDADATARRAHITHDVDVAGRFMKIASEESTSF